MRRSKHFIHFKSIVGRKREHHNQLCSSAFKRQGGNYSKGNITNLIHVSERVEQYQPLMKSYEQIKRGMERPCNQKEKIAKNYGNNNWENNCILWRAECILMQSDGISHGFIVLYAMGFHTLGVMLN